MEDNACDGQLPLPSMRPHVAKDRGVAKVKSGRVSVSLGDGIMVESMTVPDRP